jgi:hypothetical protein
MAAIYSFTNSCSVHVSKLRYDYILLTIDITFQSLLHVSLNQLKFQFTIDTVNTHDLMMSITFGGHSRLLRSWFDVIRIAGLLLPNQPFLQPIHRLEQIMKENNKIHKLNSNNFNYNIITTSNFYLITLLQSMRCSIHFNEMQDGCCKPNVHAWKLQLLV